jgi:hypothetical protein
MLVLEGRIPPPVQQSLVGREKAVLTLHRAPISAPSPATTTPACSRDLPERGLRVIAKNISTVPVLPEVLHALANERIVRVMVNLLEAWNAAPRSAPRTTQI